jgi:hypothetical protein
MTISNSVRRLSKGTRSVAKMGANTVRRSFKKASKTSRRALRSVAKRVGSLGKRKYTRSKKSTKKPSKRSSKKGSSKKNKRGGAVRMPSEYFGGSSGRYSGTPNNHIGVSQGTIAGCMAGPNMGRSPKLNMSGGSCGCGDKSNKRTNL